MAVPGPVVALVAVPGDAQVALSWTVPVGPTAPAITDYTVFYQITDDPGWTTWAHAPSTATSATVTGLTNGTTYSFYLQAINADGAGTASATVSATPGVAGDRHDAAQVLVGDSGVVAYTMVGATRETDEPPDSTGDGTGGTLWFRYTPSGPGTLTVTTDDPNGVVEIYDADPFGEIDLLGLGGNDTVVAGGLDYYLRVHPTTAGLEGSGLHLTYAFTARVQDFTLVVRANLEVAPGTLQVDVSQGVPGEEVAFSITGHSGNPVLTDTLDSTGQLLNVSVPVSDGGMGTYQLVAVTATFTDAATFLVLTEPVPPEPPLVAVPPVLPPVTPVQRWVLQDPVPGGDDSYTFPINPASMTSPFPDRTLTAASTVAQGGQDLIWEGAARAHVWSFAGYCGSREQHDALLSYSRLNRRFYLIDHRRRAWEVTFESFEINQRNEINNPWALDYTVNALVYSGPVQP